MPTMRRAERRAVVERSAFERLHTAEGRAAEPVVVPWSEWRVRVLLG